ncbi:replication stress response regulator SDE2-like isoform X2 [Pomacea canaliculata]|uniref:replication stress response regulator SDE2-like isoform X2 n=1 Tax=Pomacea canaliculata TaxID=400727 RepID=UPI000D72FE45|nr:replication stress response regulator SDE2-like isoform X2 [Pomacea canaliculata]
MIIKLWTTLGSVCVNGENCRTFSDVETLLNLKSETFYLQNNGRLVSPSQQLKHGEVYCLLPRVVGGKGGFGSMLRAIGAQIEKTTSREACRDLSGRRMRDVNNEKKLKEWVAKQADREREKERQRQEKKARLHSQTQSPKLSDPAYTEQCAVVQKDLEDALTEGLKKAKSLSATSTCGSSHETRKRKAEDCGASSSKRKWEWFGVEADSDDAGSEDDQGKPADLPISSESIGTLEDSSGPQENVTADDQEDKQVEQETEQMTHLQNCASNPDGQKGCSEGDSKLQSQTDVNHSVVLENVSSAKELEALGLDRLKIELMARGLKCGGTVQERALRLYSVKGLSSDQINPALLARPTKAKKGK